MVHYRIKICLVSYPWDEQALLKRNPAHFGDLNLASFLTANLKEGGPKVKDFLSKKEAQVPHLVQFDLLVGLVLCLDVVDAVRGIDVFGRSRSQLHKEPSLVIVKLVWKSIPRVNLHNDPH